MQKKKVTTNFLRIYQSIFPIGLQRKRIKLRGKREKEKKRIEPSTINSLLHPTKSFCRYWIIRLREEREK
jgi:hypothetical protein